MSFSPGCQTRRNFLSFVFNSKFSPGLGKNFVYKQMELIYRNLLISLLCGSLFGFAWWLMIDIFALYKEVRTHRHGIFFLPIILSTVSLFVNSAVPNSSLVDVYSLTKQVFVHRLIFFLSTSLGFSGLLSAVIVCVMKEAASLPLYALIGVPLLNAFILIANLTFKFGIVDEDDYTL